MVLFYKDKSIEPSSHQGFTLIELSIVLAIIGLLVGGVLVGQDLIYAAEMRKTISQYEKFDVAVNTFKLKFHCLPGDCGIASQYGFDPATNGNNDGIIGGCQHAISCINGAYIAATTPEYINFWYHLSAASLIPYGIQPFSAYTPLQQAQAGISTPPTVLRTSGTASGPGGWSVRAEVSAGSFINGSLNLASVHSLLGHHFLLNTKATPTPLQVNVGYFLITDLYAIDQKIDDGLPASGKAVTWLGTAQTGATVGYVYLTYVDQLMGGQGNQCTTYASPPLYNVTTSAQPPCGMMIKSSF